MRLHAMSDLHLDYEDNWKVFEALSPTEYQRDGLLLAGDLTDDLEKLRRALASVRGKFAEVFFVPGNHELWVRRGECEDSWAKFRRILALCSSLDIRTTAHKMGSGKGEEVRVVPLFSWYRKPEEGEDSLYVVKEGEDPTLRMWSDNYFVRWPDDLAAGSITDHFLRMNEEHLTAEDDVPVVSLSHFLPRRDLIYSTPEERAASGLVVRDRNRKFNFSRVAGCTAIETQVRQLRSKVHVYGHQHRNRCRMVEGVLYVSHCMGYPQERTARFLGTNVTLPRLVWDGQPRREGDS